jgi:hypothetical protein
MNQYTSLYFIIVELMSYICEFQINSNMTQPGPSATTARHAPTATISKGPASTKKRKNDNTAPNVITPSAATTPSGLRKSARIVTNTVDPIGTQQSTNKP